MKIIILNTIKYSAGLTILLPFTSILLCYSFFYLVVNEPQEVGYAIHDIKEIWKPYK